MTPEPTDQGPPVPPRRVTTSPALRLKTLQKRMEKTTGFCRIFGVFVARDLLHEDRKWIRPEIMKKLKSYERSLENLIEAAQANLDSLEQIQRKFNRRSSDGLCWHEPQPVNLMEHLRSLGLKV